MFKKLRRYYWLIQSFFVRHYKVITNTILTVVIISVGYTLIAKYIPAARSVIRIGLVGKYTESTMPVAIQNQVSQGLVTLDQSGDPMPALAISWEISNDNKTYTFSLDPSKRWHDGEPVRGSDINYNFQEVTTSYTPNTVSFELKEPFAPFFQAVSRPLMKNGNIGTGQYRIQKIKSLAGVLQEVTLLSEQEKYIYKFYPTESSAITAFQLGEVDQLNNITYIPPDLSSDPTLAIAPNTANSRIAVIFFNNNDSLLSSKSVRQGLAYAISDKSFVSTRARSPISQNSWGYNPLVKEYDFDPTHANNLFYTDIEKSNPPQLELKTTLTYLEVAEKIAADWRQHLGISVDVKVVTNISADYQALLTDFEPPLDPDQYTTWHSTQATNFTRYNNLKVDKLLEDGRRTLDKKLRTEIYQDFQRFLLEDSPAVFLFNTSGYSLSRQ